MVLSVLSESDGRLRYFAGRAAAFVSAADALARRLIERLNGTLAPELAVAALSALGGMRRLDAVAVFARYLEDGEGALHAS